MELLLATLASGSDSLILRSGNICSIFQRFFFVPGAFLCLEAMFTSVDQGTSAKITGNLLTVYQNRSIVCLNRVWQPLFPLFCDKTFEFAIQTWQTTLEHYYMYVKTYFLSQHRKMLILLISSCCKMCTLPTIRSRVFGCCKQYKHARSHCWQWTDFITGPNEQNQHFAELRQKYVYTYT